MKLTRQQARDVADVYRAAERVYCRTSLACCFAFARLNRDDLADRMDAVWVDHAMNKEQRHVHWMTERLEEFFGPEQQSRRVLALCFFAELIKTGDA